MKLLSIIAIILAFGPTVFDLALTGRGVSRPTRTCTTDWALTQFHTLHIGKPSLAIPPTGLAGAVLAGSGQNNQDSTVPIWTTVHATSRRALANLGSFVINFNGRGLDHQWRYIRSWWRYNSGRVIEDVLIVYFYSMPFLTVVLRIWRKRILRRRRTESKRAATLAQPSPILATSVAITSLARTNSIQTTKRNVPTSSCTKRDNSIVAVGGVATPSLGHILRYPAFNFRGCLRVVFTPTETPAEFIPPQLLGALTAYTGTVGIYKKLRVRRESSRSQRIVVITLVVLLEGFVIIHYEAVDGIAFWTITLILNPGTSCASAVSRHAGNMYRIVPKRTMTFPTRGLIEAGSPQSEIPSICSPNPQRLYRSNGMALPRASLAPKIDRRAGKPLPSQELVVQEEGSPEDERSSARVSPSFISIHSVEGMLLMGCSFIGEALHWSIRFFPRQGYHISQRPNNHGTLPTQSNLADNALFEALWGGKSVHTGILALDVPGGRIKGPLATREVEITAIPLPPSMLEAPTATTMFDDSKAPCYALVPFQRVVGVEPATLEMTARPQDRSTIERVRIRRGLYGHHLKATFISHSLSRPSSTVRKISAITDLTLHGTCPHAWSRATSSSATPFQTVSHVEPKTQVGRAQSVNLSDASNMDQSEEEEIKDSTTKNAAFIPLPPSRPTSPEAEEVNHTVGEEFLQADLIPLPESRPESPELHGPDPSTRSLDMYQYIAALTHQYLSLRAVLFRPILLEESRAIRAELRPRLSGLREQALIRHGLGLPAPVEAELEVQQQEAEEEVMVEEEVQEEGQEEQEEQYEEEPGDDLEIDPSAENQDVGNVEDASRRPFRLKIPTAVIRHISTNTM